MKNKNNANNSKNNTKKSPNANFVPPSKKKTGQIEIKSNSSLHPNYRVIDVKMTDDTIFQVKSTYSKNLMKLEIDPLTHPAWTGKTGHLMKVGAVERFMKNFGDLKMTDLKKKPILQPLLKKMK